MAWIDIIGLDIATLPYVNQLRLAIWERCVACGATTYAALYGGATFVPLTAATMLQDVSHRAMWLNMQASILACLGTNKWVNHTLDLAVSDTSVPWFYGDEFWAAAGIPGGFRRAPVSYPSDWTRQDDPAYSRGTIERGHLFGPWIVADLRAAIGALRWTVEQGSTVDAAKRWSGDGVGQPPDVGGCNTSRDSMQAYWYAGSPTVPLWNAFATGPMYRSFAFLSSGFDYWGSDNTYRAYAERYRGRSQVLGIPVHIPCSSELWVYPQPAFPELSYPIQYQDIDGLGLGNRIMHFVEAFPVDQVDHLVSNVLGDSDACPIDAIGCPVQGDSVASGVDIHLSQWVLKWQFTPP